MKFVNAFIFFTICSFVYSQSKKEQIENEFGSLLVWERMDDKRMSRVKFEYPDVSVFQEDDWGKMIDFMKVYVPKFEAAFKSVVE